MSTATTKKAVQPARAPQFGPNGTNVLGYFNGNAWPVQLSISALGRIFNIQPGEFIQDGRGGKFNDPVFEPYVGPNLLSREWVPGNAVTPVRKVPALQQIQSTNASGFTGTPNTNTLPNANAPVVAPANMVAPSINSSPVKGFSIEEARKAGLIRDSHEPNQTALRDDGSLPPGEVLETIEYAHDVPTRRPQPPRAPAPVVIPPPPAPAPAMAYDDQEAKVLHEMQSAAKVIDPENPNVLSNIARTVARQVAQPVAAPVSLPPTLPEPNLPEPNLNEAAPAGPTPATATDAEKAFVCAADGKGFDYRSQLVRHIERKYPERKDELLARYPKN